MVERQRPTLDRQVGGRLLYHLHAAKAWISSNTRRSKTSWRNTVTGWNRVLKQALPRLAWPKPGTYKWYEVQDAIDYWQEFDKPKIIYQVIATYQQFAFAETFVSNDKTWIIPTPCRGLLAYSIREYRCGSSLIGQAPNFGSRI